jgi:hypothetical protein
MSRTWSRIAVVLGIFAALSFAYLKGKTDALDDDGVARAANVTQDEVSPVKARGDRLVYYPNTEDLGPDEMRVISLGTGMPNQRPSQKATAWFVELGNGDKFLFDIGTGSTDNLAMLDIPQDYVDKIFISHLHTDHFGDFGALFVGGLINGRTVPLRIWGPSGETPERGTKYAIESWRNALSWDVDGRAGRLPRSGRGRRSTSWTVPSATAWNGTASSSCSEVTPIPTPGFPGSLRELIWSSTSASSPFRILSTR